MSPPTKPIIKKIVYLFLFITFLLGIYFCIYGSKRAPFENFENASTAAAASSTSASSAKDGLNCADLLVRRGETLVLYNTKNSAIPPVSFKNLDEYVSYLEKQREKGVRCPVLYLQEENNAQGENVFRIRPGFNNLENGLPANTYIPGVVVVKENGGFNTQNAGIAPTEEVPIVNSAHGYAPFDPYGQNIGDFTSLDRLHIQGETEYKSDSAMDPNWGGPDHTRAQVESGKYDGNLVMRPNLITPKN